MKANGDTVKSAGDLLRDPAMTMAMTAWDLERTWENWPQAPRARLIYLRTHKRLQNTLEAKQRVAADQRSYIEIVDGSSTACLLIPDLSGAPADLHPLAQHLFEDGLTVYSMVLPGSGVKADMPSEVMWRACLNEVKLRYRILRKVYKNVFIVGYGFGAALAVLLARKEQTPGIALLAPAIIPRVTFLKRLGLRLKLHRLRWLHSYLGWNPEVLEGMETARGQIGHLRPPVYAAQCDDDERISPLSLRLLQKRSRHRASRFRVFGSGGHAILAAHGKEALNGEILEFFRTANRAR
ncbi:MAG: hypothetical protein ABIF77_04320 [bacterium]